MKVVLFGASGGVGRLLLRELLDQEHTIEAGVRDPAKIDVHHARLTVVRGDVTDPEAVRSAVADAEAVVSVVGQSRGSPTDLLARFAANLGPALAGTDVQRVVTLVGAGVTWPGDGPPGLGRRAMWR